jgi:dipeptidase E
MPRRSVKLVFYSGGDADENKELDRRLIQLAQKPSPRMAYVPYSYYESDSHFGEFVEQYRPFGVQKFINFPIDIPAGKALRKEAFDCEIMHLSGGNTFYFLQSIRKSGLIGEFRRFVARGGVLTGLSAGAILMTRDIQTAGFPEFDRDDNEDDIKDLRALKLVDFHFYPHYKNSRRYDVELKKFSLKNDGPLYACPDGAGIIVEKKQLTFVGRCHVFLEGRKFAINSKA